jgi:hypothetical protein
MSEYVVTCDLLELPRGSTFVVLPGVPAQPGQLTLVQVFDYLIPGRFTPAVDGVAELRLPKHILELAGKCEYRVIGAIVPIDVDVKPIMPEGENPFPRWLVC